MPPEVRTSEGPSELVDRSSRRKEYTRYSIHILHLIVSLLLLLVIIIYLSFSSCSLFMLYLLPFIVAVATNEAYYIGHRKPPLALQRSLFSPRSLVGRSLRYQIAASFAAGWTVYTNWYLERPFWAMIILEAIIWIFGVVFLILALLARKCGFQDWLEEQEPGAIDLDDTELLLGPGPRPGLVEDSKSKHIVQYLMHIFHLCISLLLLTFIFVNNHSTENSPFNLYLFPLIIELLVVELCYLFYRHPPSSLVDGILTPRRLLGRAFAYQLAGAFTLGYAGGDGKYSQYHTQSARGLAYTVWLLGIGLFAVAITAQEYGFRSWVEQPELDVGVGRSVSLGVDEELGHDGSEEQPRASESLI